MLLVFARLASRPFHISPATAKGRGADGALSLYYFLSLSSHPFLPRFSLLMGDGEGGNKSKSKAMGGATSPDLHLAKRPLRIRLWIIIRRRRGSYDPSGVLLTSKFPYPNLITAPPLPDERDAFSVPPHFV